MLKVEGIADVATVGDIARHHARTRPDRIAIHFEGQRITFAELDRRANQVANGLISEGLRPQARIAFLSKNVPAFFELWFGAVKADVVLVPVNFRLAPPEVPLWWRMRVRRCCSSAPISIRSSKKWRRN